MENIKEINTMLSSMTKLPVLAGILACVAPSGIIASESEFFSLLGQPGVLLDGADSTTQTGNYNGIPYEVIHGFAVAQGDMVLGRVLPNGKLLVEIQPRGIGQASAFERWVDGVVPYQFANEITQQQRDRATLAIAHWNANTTIKMVERTSANESEYSDYINFELGGGCASYVGKTGGEQSVWLADNCTVGSIIHEIGHAIGLFHEHTRPDRNSFVTILEDNITNNKQINFETIVAGAENYSDYDYGSIMHYGEFFFTNNGEPTITVPDGQSIGQREALSALDISSVNNMYATDVQLRLSTTANEDNTQIDLVVSNIGELGASDLQLTANWGDSADWISVSNDSGWTCEKFDTELRCKRSSLAGASDSLFSILVDPQSAPVDQLSVRVLSRTQDNDESNNAFNDTISDEPETPEVSDTNELILAPIPAEPMEPNTTNELGNTDTQVSEPENETPTVDAPEVEQESAPTVTTTDETTIDQNTTTGGTPPVVVSSSNENDSVGTNGETSNTITTAINGSAAESETPEIGAASGGSSGGGAAFYLLALLFGARLKRRH